MKNIFKILGGCALALAVAGSASAGSFEDSMGRCLMKNGSKTGTVKVPMRFPGGG